MTKTNSTKKPPLERQSKNSGHGGTRPGAGRPKGSLDKGNALIREMVVQALNKAGGIAYLSRIAESHPAAFLALVSKVMPIQIEGTAPDGSIAATLTIEYVRPNPAA